MMKKYVFLSYDLSKELQYPPLVFTLLKRFHIFSRYNHKMHVKKQEKNKYLGDQQNVMYNCEVEGFVFHYFVCNVRSSYHAFYQPGCWLP